MTRQSYKHVLRAKGVRPVRGPLRTERGEGHRELLPVTGSGVWQNGSFRRVES